MKIRAQIRVPHNGPIKSAQHNQRRSAMVRIILDCPALEAGNGGMQVK
jgi:hypothetical protein